MKHTHYADIEESTVWRVNFTPPAEMTQEQIREWLRENWDNPDEAEKEVRVYDEFELVFIAEHGEE